MAPSNESKENRYVDLSLDDIKSELNKRKLEFNESETKDNLIILLIKDDSKPPDWGKIYSRVLYHTGMGYEEIARRTIPQIMAILDGAEENISLKIGMPNMFGGVPSTGNVQTPMATEPPKLSQFMNLANAFN